MPATFIPDTVDGSMVELLGQATSAVRTGIVEGLPTTGDTSAVLWAAMTATNMPATGSLYPGLGNCYLTRIQVYGVSVDMARVRLIYEPFQAAVNSAVIIDIGSTLSTYSTNMLPGTREPFKVDYVPPAGTNGQYIPPDLLTIQMLRPLRKVSVTKLQPGVLEPVTAALMASYVGHVNSDTWFGLPPGSWIVSSANASIARIGNYYQTRLEALSQGTDLWRYFGVMRSQWTGKYAVDSNTVSTINTLRSNAYPDSPKVWTGNGVIAIDPYQKTNFSSLFGI